MIFIFIFSVLLYTFFLGANPNRQDTGRGLCAEEWARFCGRQNCADAISKYVHSKKYFFKKTFMMTREKWSSEPDLTSHFRSSRRNKEGGNWLTRHLSFKRKGQRNQRETSERTESGEISPLSADGRSNSSPLLTCTTPSPPPSPKPNMRRPSCIDGVVNVNIKSLRSKGGAPFNIPIVEEAPRKKPPQILQTDFDDDTGAKPVECKVDQRSTTPSPISEEEEEEEDDGQVWVVFLRVFCFLQLAQARYYFILFSENGLVSNVSIILMSLLKFGHISIYTAI